jgi:hypothetical protein
MDENVIVITRSIVNSETAVLADLADLDERSGAGRRRDGRAGRPHDAHARPDTAAAGDEARVDRLPFGLV